MTLDLDAVGRSAGPSEVSWTSTDALLYALGVGAGQADPLAELELTTENTAGVEQVILPTYAILLGQKARGLHVGFGDFDRTKLVHAEQSLTLHRALPVEGSAKLTSTLTGIYDKGAGALVTTTTEGVLADSGEPLFATTSAAFIRGEGGFGGDRGSAPEWAVPDGKPDHEVTVATRPDQALLYRLTGDRNPLHSDPSFAGRGGFSRPILHGLCTYGITARVLLQAIGARPADLASITGRFTSPVLPGDALTVNVWSDGGTHRFRVTGADGATVLDRGAVTTR
ncbi:MAG TPA: MaoC/PaaZ C-terminal domain-containing protein [Mycobacteriales bacterium]